MRRRRKRRSTGRRRWTRKYRRRRGRGFRMIRLKAAQRQGGDVGWGVLAGGDKAGQQPQHLLSQGLAQDQAHVIP